MRIARDHLGIVDVPPKEGTENRQVLSCLLIERTDHDGAGRIIGADGFCLVVVPCQLAPDDLPGLVIADALRQAAKGTTKRSSDVLVTLGAEMVTGATGASFPRLGTLALGVTDTYPDYRRIVPRGLDGTVMSGQSRPFAFDHELLSKLGKALGGYGLVLWPNPHPTGPMIATPVGNNEIFERGEPIAPYGVLMPMHSRALAAWEETHKPGLRVVARSA
jgi:hypothetical protein